MNKFLATAILFSLIILSACNQQEIGVKAEENEFTIQGEFALADPTPVMLYYLGSSESQLIDSIYVEKTKFQFRQNVEHPVIYVVRFFNDQEIYLILHPGDDIKLDIDNSHAEISYYVENSFESKRIKELMDQHNFALREIDQLSQEYQANFGDTDARNHVDSAYAAILREQKKFAEDFIKKEPASLANILAIHLNMGRNQPLFDRYDDIELFSFIDSCLVGAYPTAAPVQVLNMEVNELKLEIANRKYVRKIVDAGRPLPPLQAVSVAGDSLILSEDPGKPVLLYFWASWNPYSVEELLKLDDFYKKTAPGKIRILSISLDSREKELLQFLGENKLSIPIICDYQYWDSELAARYAVKQVPSVLLTNKQGLIIAKDILGAELYRYLDMAVN